MSSIARPRRIDWDRIVATVDDYLPRPHRASIHRIARDLDRVLAGFVRGQMTVCLILGTFYAVALLAVGLSFGLLIGVFAGLISFIPFVVFVELVRNRAIPDPADHRGLVGAPLDEILGADGVVERLSERYIAETYTEKLGILRHVSSPKHGKGSK